MTPSAVNCAAAIAVLHPFQSGAVLGDPDLTHHAFHHWLFQLPLVAEAALEAEDLAMVDYLWSPTLSDGHHIEQVKRETLRAPGAIAAALGYYRSITRLLLEWFTEARPG